MFSLKLLLLIVGLINGFISASAEGRVERIFKGEYDKENEHRYHVAILKLLPNDTTEHVCGGAILNSHYVLTAAHCVYGERKSELLVRSGWNKSPAKPWLERREYHKVARIMYLKDYVYAGCRHHQNDIAILKVVRQFDLADAKNFRKVALPAQGNDYEDVDATFTGYGIEKISMFVNKSNHAIRKVFKYPEELKFLQTRVLSPEDCKRHSHLVVTPGNLCTEAQNPKGFSCVGDSGGPLVSNGVVIGIRNSHNNECLHERPELFTRVSHYLTFIRNVLNHENSYDIVYV